MEDDKAGQVLGRSGINTEIDRRQTLGLKPAMDGRHEGEWRSGAEAP